MPTCGAARQPDLFTGTVPSHALAPGTAVLSPCETWRYRLTRDVSEEGLVASFGGVNPARADARLDDHTVRKLKGFGRRIGIRRWILWNPFAGRATDVRDLAGMADPVGPENDLWIRRALQEADLHVVGWGPETKVPRRLRYRFAETLAIAAQEGAVLHCFGTAKCGAPRHPLRLSYDAPLEPWHGRRYRHPDTAAA